MAVLRHKNVTQRLTFKRAKSTDRAQQRLREAARAAEPGAAAPGRVG